MFEWLVSALLVGLSWLTGWEWPIAVMVLVLLIWSFRIETTSAKKLWRWFNDDDE